MAAIINFESLFMNFSLVFRAQTKLFVVSPNKDTFESETGKNALNLNHLKLSLLKRANWIVARRKITFTAIWGFFVNHWTLLIKIGWVRAKVVEQYL